MCQECKERTCESCDRFNAFLGCTDPIASKLYLDLERRVSREFAVRISKVCFRHRKRLNFVTHEGRHVKCIKCCCGIKKEEELKFIHERCYEELIDKIKDIRELLND